MASIVKFTPITGSFQEACPVAYLLEIDSQKLLLDCGILSADVNGRFRIDEGYLKALKKAAKTVDAVLLSHGDLKHCGGLPLIVDCLAPNVPIYATVPVHHMGLMTLYDTLQSLEPFNSVPFGYDQVDAAFDRIQRLRYSQPVALAGSINLLALPAGHSIGGTMWRIRKAPAEDILYTPTFNHKREAHLDGAVFDAISRPSLMIVDASQSLAPAVVRKDRDAGLFTAVASTLRAGGSVLIPCDSALRLLELSFVLEGGWNDLMAATRVSARAYILTHQAYRTLEFAKGMLEWMSQSVMKSFDTDRTNPFDFKHLRLIHSLEEISQSTPAVILASSEFLDFGLSHALLASFVRSSANVILAPFEPLPGSVLARLLGESHLNEIKIKTWKRVPLEGDELAAHLAKELEAEEKRAADAAFAAYERAHRQGVLAGDELDGFDEASGVAAVEAGDEASLSGLLERQIDDVEAFRNIFWVDYRSDWNVKPEDPINLLVKQPELLSDIYLQIGTPGQRFQCFPARDVIRSVNEYGEVVSITEFEIVKPIDSDTSTAASTSPTKSTTQSTQAKAVQPQIPFKWTCQEVGVAVKCSRRRLVGFGGLSDGRSLKTIISRINPRKLIFVGGSQEATEFLYNHYKCAEDSIEVFAPKIAECVNASSAMNLLSAVISEALLNQLRVSSFGDYDISHLQGRFRIKKSTTEEEEEEEEASHDKKDTEMEVDSVAAVPEQQQVALEIAPAPLSMVPACPGVIVGDLKLSELRRYISLKYSGMNTEFSANGDLICSGKVIVKRDQGSGQIWIEGPLCKEYYQVRNSLYENVTMV